MAVTPQELEHLLDRPSFQPPAGVAPKARLDWTRCERVPLRRVAATVTRGSAGRGNSRRTPRDREWLQLDAGSEKQIYGIVTQVQGYHDMEEEDGHKRSLPLPGFTLTHSVDLQDWEDVPGGSYSGPVWLFSRSVCARYIRITPEQEGGPNIRAGLLLRDEDVIPVHLLRQLFDDWYAAQELRRENAALREALDYASLLLPQVDWVAIADAAEKRKALWLMPGADQPEGDPDKAAQTIASYLDPREALALRYQPRLHSIGDAAMQKWYQCRQRVFHIPKEAGNNRRRLCVPGKGRYRIEKAVTMRVVIGDTPCADKQVFEAPGDLVVAGYGKMALSFIPSPKKGPLKKPGQQRQAGGRPQGQLTMIESPALGQCVQIHFEHARWFANDSDGVALVPAGAMDNQSEVHGFVSNEDMENPWEVIFPLPSTMPAGNYEFRYVDGMSLCTLAKTSPFPLSGEDRANNRPGGRYR